MLPRRHPSDIHDARLLNVLEKYVPPIIARSIIERARREASTGPDVSWTDPNGLLDRLSVGVRLFAAPEHVSPILREITDLAVADQEDEAPASQRGEDSAPASTLKPSSARSRLDEARARIEDARSRIVDEPASRRDATPAPPSAPSSQATGPLSRRGEHPSSSRRDADAAFSTLRNPQDPPPAPDAWSTGAAARTPSPSPVVRGVFPTSSGAVRPSPAAPPRIPPDRPSASSSTSQMMPAIPPPPAPPRAAGAPLITRAAAPPAPAQNKPGDQPNEITITLTTEHDVPRARQVAREICESLGTRALTQQRLVTIVSELGRNMVLYAGGGKITLRPPINASRRVVVIAVDQGPGISNLSEIMAGKYKSRSGLGLGIVGTKRLADSFHIETGRHGTAVSVEVIV